MTLEKPRGLQTNCHKIEKQVGFCLNIDTLNKSFRISPETDLKFTTMFKLRIFFIKKKGRRRRRRKLGMI